MFRDGEITNQNRSPGRHKLLAEDRNLATSLLRSLIPSELILFATIAICTVVLQSNLVNVYGISYFGIRLKTIPIVAAGFVIGGSLLYLTSNKITAQEEPWRLIRLTLRVVAVGIVLLLLTPYTLDTFFNWTHMAIGAAIFALQMYMSAVVTFRYSKDKISKIALLVQFIGGVLAMLSLPDNMLNFMLEGEVIFQIGFMALLNRTIRLKLATLAE